MLDALFSIKLRPQVAHLLVDEVRVLSSDRRLGISVVPGLLHLAQFGSEGCYFHGPAHLCCLDFWQTLTGIFDAINAHARHRSPPRSGHHSGGALFAIFAVNTGEGFGLST